MVPLENRGLRHIKQMLWLCPILIPICYTAIDNYNRHISYKYPSTLRHKETKYLCVMLIVLAADRFSYLILMSWMRLEKETIFGRILQWIKFFSIKNIITVITKLKTCRYCHYALLLYKLSSFFWEIIIIIQ